MKHLVQFEVKAKARYDKGQYWWELRACDYYNEFEKLKIIFPDIATRAECMLDYTQSYCVNTAYIIPVEDYYLLGILNSNVVHFFYSSLTTSIRGGYLRFIRQFVEQIPIPLGEPQKEISTLVNSRIKSEDDHKSYEIESQINQLVYQLYGLTEEEIGIVEGR